MYATFEAPPPRYEAALDDRPGSTERAQLDAALDDLLGQLDARMTSCFGLARPAADRSRARDAERSSHV